MLEKVRRNFPERCYSLTTAPVYAALQRKKTHPEITCRDFPSQARNDLCVLGLLFFFLFPPQAVRVSVGRSSLEESGGSVGGIQVESSGGLGGGGALTGQRCRQECRLETWKDAPEIILSGLERRRAS